MWTHLIVKLTKTSRLSPVHFFFLGLSKRLNQCRSSLLSIRHVPDFFLWAVSSNPELQRQESHLQSTLSRTICRLPARDNSCFHGFLLVCFLPVPSNKSLDRVTVVLCMYLPIRTVTSELIVRGHIVNLCATQRHLSGWLPGGKLLDEADPVQPRACRLLKLRRKSLHNGENKDASS